MLALVMLVPVALILDVERLWAAGRPAAGAWAALPAGCDRITSCAPGRWQDVAGVASFGYRGEPVAYRFPVRSATEPRLLLLRPHYLDDARLYDQSGSALATLGDSHASGGGRRANLFYTVELPSSVSELTLVLRSSSALIADVAVVAAPQAARIHRNTMAALLVYLALVLGTLGWALVRCFVAPDGLVALFALKQGADVLYIAVSSGLAAWLFAPGDSGGFHHLAAWVFVGVSCAGLLFYSRLLAGGRGRPWLRVALMLGAATLMLALLLLAVGAVRPAMWLNMVAVAALPVIFLVAAWRMPAQQAAIVPRRLLTGYFALLCLPVVISALSILGVLPGVSLAMNGLLVHGGLGAVLMTMLLRSRDARQERRIAALEVRARLSEAQLAHESRERARHAFFLDLLTHELRAPLTVIRLALTHPRAPDRLVAKAIDASLQADAILEQALRAASSSHDTAPNDAGRQSLNSVLEASLARHARAVRERVVWEIDDVEVDPHVGRLVLDNLLDNALAYGAPA